MKVEDLIPYINNYLIKENREKEAATWHIKFLRMKFYLTN